MGLFDRFKRDEPSAPATDVVPERQPFGYKTGWIAAQTDNLAALANALGILGQQPAPWASGISEAYGGGVFVCPTVDGWTLAMGEGILTGDNIDLAAVSRTLGVEAQLFRTHRIVEHHEWARAIDGEITRSFSYLGETGEITKNDGAATPTELMESAAAYCAEIAVGPFPFDDDTEYPDESTVIAMAAGWSIDPTTLRGPDDRQGIIGRLPY